MRLDNGPLSYHDFSLRRAPSQRRIKTIDKASGGDTGTGSLCAAAPPHAMPFTIHNISRPVSGLASGGLHRADRLPTLKCSGFVIRRNSPTVAGAAPALRSVFRRRAPASHFIPRANTVGTPEALAVYPAAADSATVSTQYRRSPCRKTVSGWQHLTSEN